MMQTKSSPWKGSWLRWSPLLATAALTVAFMCTMASLGVLLVSNGQRVSIWTLKPAVLLAIFSTIANSTLTFALSQGVTITWWQRALRGTTIAELDRTWDYAQSPIALLKSTLHLDKAAIATLFTLLMLLDGPLLQRASIVQSSTFETTLNISLQVAVELPPGFTGAMDPNATTISGNPLFFLLVQKNWRQPDFISSLLDTPSECNGSCNGTVRAAGVVSVCSTQTYDHDFSEATVNQPGLAFSTNYTMPPSPELTIRALSTRMNKGCVGTVTQRTCKLRSASIDYPISIQNTTIVLGAFGTRNPSYYDGGDSNMTLGADSGPLHGIALMLEAFYLSNATIYQTDTGDPSVPYQTYTEGTQAAEYMDLTPIDGSSTTNSSFNASEPLTCQLSSWINPMDDMLRSIDYLMFRTALFSAEIRNTSLITLGGSPDFPIAGPFPAVQSIHGLAFRTNVQYTVFTAVFMCVCLLTAVPTLWGWWKLGRSFSLSPVEIAKAFAAPCLESQADPISSNASASTVVKQFGSKRVAYGVLRQTGPQSTGLQRLAFGSTNEVTLPRNGEIFA